MAEQDPLLEALSKLPERDVGDWRREHLRTSAHRALNAGERSPVVRFYERFVEPASVYGFGVIYLAWAFGRVATIYG